METSCIRCHLRDPSSEGARTRPSARRFGTNRKPILSGRDCRYIIAGIEHLWRTRTVADPAERGISGRSDKRRKRRTLRFYTLRVLFLCSLMVKHNVLPSSKTLKSIGELKENEIQCHFLAIIINYNRKIR